MYQVTPWVASRVNPAVVVCSATSENPKSDMCTCNWSSTSILACKVERGAKSHAISQSTNGSMNSTSAATYPVKVSVNDTFIMQVSETAGDLANLT